MDEKYIFDVKKLNEIIEEGKKDPKREDGELTVLRDNCMKNFKDELGNLATCIIKIKGYDITINDQDRLREKFYTIPPGYEIDDKGKIYRQVKSAMKEAKNLGIFNEVFKEIKNAEGNKGN